MFIALLKNKKLWLFVFLVTCNKYSYGMYGDTSKSRGSQDDPVHVSIQSYPLWELSKGFILLGLGAGGHYLYQKWYAKPEEQIIENKEKLLELDIKEAHLIQNHEEALIKFLHCEEKGLDEKFCKDMFNVHKQALDRITTKDFVFNKNNTNKKLS